MVTYPLNGTLLKMSHIYRCYLEQLLQYLQYYKKVIEIAICHLYTMSFVRKG